MTKKKGRGGGEAPFIWLRPNPVPFAITWSFVITFNGNSAGVLDYKCFQARAVSTSVTCTGQTGFGTSICNLQYCCVWVFEHCAAEIPLLTKFTRVAEEKQFYKIACVIFKAFHYISSFSVAFQFFLEVTLSSHISILLHNRTRNLVFL